MIQVAADQPPPVGTFSDALRARVNSLSYLPTAWVWRSGSSSWASCRTQRPGLRPRDQR